MNICENCGCSHDGLYGSGRFCSAKCARWFSTKSKRAEINKKVSTTLTGRHYHRKTNTYVYEEPRYCKHCGVQLYRSNKSGYCRNCFRSCSPAFTSAEYKEKLRQSQLRLVANGTHKGWRTRNIKSYAEKFFETVLNHNRILYDRERYVGKYFLDFVIGDIDLEIDGKQHQYADRKKSDRVRDEYLRSQGFFVYRIKWNEINSDIGKEMMKDKIDLFLDFVDNFVNV